MLVDGQIDWVKRYMVSKSDYMEQGHYHCNRKLNAFQWDWQL